MGADTAAELLAEGERLVAEIDALAAGPKRLAAYYRLKDVVERAESALQEERT
ncbi:hypothetical protein [Vreelandella maris]|uniref:Uncharacterized protein n=1 Tax=Vreelandella maris TaxID=2729617 RepID=A0A7Y6RFT7_9GAMM|nr:hypothetical protein [Halomonas maris]NVF16247.1 hypothetical protein [Halomonas maris]|tara:strand:+ start:413 stop:571 length:159 start_codon:yes stop_codon:yes gene_type:complete